MTTTDLTSLRAAAARNNADWCAAVCRSHGTPGTYGDTAWWSSARTPLYYPDAVTLRPDAVPDDFLPALDTVSPGCSVKDSFAALDLTAEGFSVLFEARWIHRAAGLPVPAGPVPPAEPVRSAAGLGAWQDAWHGQDPAAPDIFRPALLDDPSVLVLAVRAGGGLSGGAVLYRAAGLTGLSNFFAVPAADPAVVSASVLTAAARHFPGLPVVGYERGEDLAPARAAGFTELGELRVWLGEL